MKPDNKLTHRQAEILDFIRECQEKMGAPPTQGEIAARFGLKSTYGVRQHLNLMQKKGYLHLINGKARGIKLNSSFHSERDNALCEIPLVGLIAAGHPILTVEDVQEYFKIGVGIFHGRNLFALRVQGDSMINVGIVEDDIAIINQQPQVDSGDIAVVILDDEATLKRVILEHGRVRLKAENDRYQDIVITPKSTRNFRIAGRFVGLIRQRHQLKSFKSCYLS